MTLSCQDKIKGQGSRSFLGGIFFWLIQIWYSLQKYKLQKNGKLKAIWFYKSKGYGIKAIYANKIFSLKIQIMTFKKLSYIHMNTHTHINRHTSHSVILTNQFFQSKIEEILIGFFLNLLWNKNIVHLDLFKKFKSGSFNCNQIQFCSSM